MDDAEQMSLHIGQTRHSGAGKPQGISKDNGELTILSEPYAACKRFAISCVPSGLLSSMMMTSKLRFLCHTTLDSAALIIVCSSV